jgi:hypothetical protein
MNKIEGLIKEIKNNENILECQKHKLVGLVLPVIVKIHETIGRDLWTGPHTTDFKGLDLSCDIDSPGVITFKWRDRWGDGGSRIIPIELVEDENELQLYLNGIIENKAIDLLRWRNERRKKLEEELKQYG